MTKQVTMQQVLDSMELFEAYLNGEVEVSTSWVYDYLMFKGVTVEAYLSGDFEVEVDWYTAHIEMLSAKLAA